MTEAQWLHCTGPSVVLQAFAQYGASQKLEALPLQQGQQVEDMQILHVWPSECNLVRVAVADSRVLEHATST